MPRPCKICSTPALARVADRLIAKGVSDREIERVLEQKVPEAAVTNYSIRRHRINHLHVDAEYPRTQAGVKVRGEAARPGAPKGAQPPRASHRAGRAAPPEHAHTPDEIVPLLRKGPLAPHELGARLSMDEERAFALTEAAREAGANLHYRGGKWHLDATPEVGATRGQPLEFVTDKDGTFTFAISTDQHLCSRYERLDCLNDFYDQVEKRGIRTVLNAGNWIDGEASFNRHEIHTHGMDAQLQYLAREYPKRRGVTTYAVAGADHEGWYSRREGVDIGKYAQNVMREAGREDWHDIGYVERAIPLVHRDTGKGSNILVMHPGGGSAYATSYIPQKIVESFDGGEKPAALVLGHYHKADYTYMRNVHTMQGGCFQDQSLFMRSKRLSAHLGGCFVRLTVDPRTGAFIECQYTFRAYYVKEYYNGRWSQSGPVTRAPRMP